MEPELHGRDPTNSTLEDKEKARIYFIFQLFCCTLHNILDYMSIYMTDTTKRWLASIKGKSFFANYIQQISVPF